MKKLGLTLAEILIVLGIAGVVASVTLPTFISNNQNKLNATKLASTIQTFENAFTTMMSIEAAEDFADTEFVQKYSIDGAEDTLAKYLKITKSTSKITDFYNEDKPFKDINGTTSKNISGNYIYQTKSGAIVFFNNVARSIDETDAKNAGINITSSAFELNIDVNGNQKPNVIGRDVFNFIIGNNGLLYPLGGLVASNLIYGSSAHTYDAIISKMPCNQKKRGNYSAGCTARLIENNFVVDY